MQAESKGLPERWTSELLRRCTPKEIIIIIAAYGVSTVAARVGDDYGVHRLLPQQD